MARKCRNLFSFLNCLLLFIYLLIYLFIYLLINLFIYLLKPATVSHDI